MKKANECVNGQRDEQYGSPERNFEMIAELWSVYLGGQLKELIDASDVPIMMALLKIARIRTGNYKDDSFIDLAGYAACAGEIAANSGTCDDYVIAYFSDENGVE